MVVSVHLADVGPLGVRKMLGIELAQTDGLRYREKALAVPLASGPQRVPRLGRVGLITAWEDDGALDHFLASHPMAEMLRGGWHVRLAPLRISGAWSDLPGLPDQEEAVNGDEPVAVLTIAHTRLRRIVPFLRTSHRAERQAVEDPAMLAGTALALPPRLVATFSLWRSAVAMRAYAQGVSGQQHRNAMRANTAQPFHHESAFIRFRPYAPKGLWWGHRDPFADVTLRSAAAPQRPHRV
ncbi:MAG: spheroidene monooxygenase [Solirubrobacterales bacterium]|nr:spheroidene monooxygenase [Solirubrobacterales bacterium]